MKTTTTKRRSGVTAVIEPVEGRVLLSGTHVLYQDVLIPVSTVASVSRPATSPDGTSNTILVWDAPPAG
jgi:hypothetical protein